MRTDGEENGDTDALVWETYSGVSGRDIFVAMPDTRILTCLFVIVHGHCGSRATRRAKD